jgi:hypothetical protein
LSAEAKNIPNEVSEARTKNIDLAFQYWFPRMDPTRGPMEIRKLLLRRTKEKLLHTGESEEATATETYRSAYDRFDNFLSQDRPRYLSRPAHFLLARGAMAMP